MKQIQCYAEILPVPAKRGDEGGGSGAERLFPSLGSVLFGLQRPLAERTTKNHQREVSLVFWDVDLIFKAQGISSSYKEINHNDCNSSPHCHVLTHCCLVLREHFSKILLVGMLTIINNIIALVSTLNCHIQGVLQN